MEEQDFLPLSHKFWKKGEGVASNSRGALGGITTLWDDSKLDLVMVCSTLHWIITKFHHKNSGIQVSFFNVYVVMLL